VGGTESFDGHYQRLAMKPRRRKSESLIPFLAYRTEAKSPSAPREAGHLFREFGHVTSFVVAWYGRGMRWVGAR
jgi:hypothetical protein